MRLDGRRESGNVRDVRGSRTKGVGIGLGGLVLVGIVTLLLGGNPLAEAPPPRRDRSTAQPTVRSISTSLSSLL